MFPWLNVKTQNPSFFRNGAPAYQAKAWVVKVGLTMTTGRGFSAVGLQWKSFAPRGRHLGIERGHDAGTEIERHRQRAVLGVRR